MARAPRLTIEGGTYHLTNRGNHKSLIFRDAYDRRRFIDILARLAGELHVDILVECRMGTHFHLVGTTHLDNLPEFMGQLHAQYAKYFNRRHRLVGHLFQGPYRSVIVEHDMHLLTVIAYVLLNPVVAGHVTEVGKWRWSSYAATIGKAACPAYLWLDWLDILFPAETLQEARKQFLAFLHAPRPVMSYIEQATPVVGSIQFEREIREIIGATLCRFDLPRSYRAVGRPSLEELFPPDQTKAERDANIQRARVVHGYKLSEVARCLAMHPSSVSRIVCSRRPHSG